MIYIQLKNGIKLINIVIDNNNQNQIKKYVEVSRAFKLYKDN